MVKHDSVSICENRKFFANILIAKTVPIAIKRSFQTESLEVAEQVLLKMA